MSDHDPGYENTPKRTEREGEGNREGQRRPSASPNASASSSNVTSPALHAQAHARESPAMLPRTNSSGDTPQRVGLNLGLGRPRGPSADFRIYSGTSHSNTPASPNPPAMPIPPRRSSVSSTDDGYDSDSGATPRTTNYFPQMSSTQRTPVDGRRASDAAQQPTVPSSPHQGASQPGSSVHGRRSRVSLAPTGQAQPGLSRSGSRARIPPLGMTKGDQEDDEVVVIDRGEDLIRRRLKERKRAKRERERRLAAEAEAAEDDEDVQASAPPSATTAATDSSGPYFTGSSSVPQRSSATSPVRGHRSVSVSRARASSTARHHTTQVPSRSGSISSDAGATDRPTSSLAAGGDEDDTEEDGDHEEDEGEEPPQASDDDDEDEDGSGGDEEGVTVKDRQDAINIEHPFGLPIWKPALYRKSRSVTRNAESALHSIPSAAAERHLLVGNLLWVLLFGWWLALICANVAMIVTLAEFLVGGRGGYGRTIRGLAWYIGWPFGKYVEGEGAPEDMSSDDDASHHDEEAAPFGTDSSVNSNNFNYGSTLSTDPVHPRAFSMSTNSTATVRPGDSHSLESLPDEPHTPPTRSRTNVVSFAASAKHGSPSPPEGTPLLSARTCQPCARRGVRRRARLAGSVAYWPLFFFVIAPVMLVVCLICWCLVITIPMAKLTWELIYLLWTRPLEINFCPAPKVPVEAPIERDEEGDVIDNGGHRYVLKRARLHAGQIAPTEGPTSTVLLCTYRAVGLQYYKYTVGGVNIMFINLLPLVFFTIVDGMLILPWVEHMHGKGKHVPEFVEFISSPALIFTLGLASVIPLSYFIGMAVASISAQSSIGMGAVINATFGSIIEIVLYAIALTQGKGRLVEGSIVGSLLAGVLLMPGMSMISGAFKRKTQKFNAKSAGVTSTMLIMAIIGTLTPTMFYQTYGSFQIHCEGCPEPDNGNKTMSAAPNLAQPFDKSWECDRCYYTHPEPTTDPFYQSQVKNLMYACAFILLLSYLIGLWFSLRTHASQIWQNPQQVMVKEDLPHQHRAALARITPAAVMNPILPVSKPPSIKDRRTSDARPTPSPRRGNLSPRSLSPHATPTAANPFPSQQFHQPPPPSSLQQQHGQSSQHGQRDQRQNLHPVDVSAENGFPPRTGYTPFLQSIQQKSSGMIDNMPPLPGTLTSEDVRSVLHTLATVTAMHDRKKPEEEEESHGGHEAPSWTRFTSAAVLLSCTLLYAGIAEILVDVVDVVLKGSGVDEKFLGLTLFALVPNTTEFMNAISFAMNGNISLSMEIGSAYALQVCLLQIPAMVAFSAVYNPSKVGDDVDTFTLIFPRWDVIAIILAIFLLTYTYIEARSNYHRGSMLVLAYIVLVLGFYFAPAPVESPDPSVVVGHDSIEGFAMSASVALSRLWV